MDRYSEQDRLGFLYLLLPPAVMPGCDCKESSIMRMATLSVIIIIIEHMKDSLLRCRIMQFIPQSDLLRVGCRVGVVADITMGNSFEVTPVMGPVWPAWSNKALGNFLVIINLEWHNEVGPFRWVGKVWYIRVYEFLIAMCWSSGFAWNSQETLDNERVEIFFLGCWNRKIFSLWLFEDFRS